MAKKLGSTFEPGMWIHVPSTTIPALGESVTRMASIPHERRSRHKDWSRLPGRAAEHRCGGYHTVPDCKQCHQDQVCQPDCRQYANARIPQDLGPFITRGTITQAMLDDPNSLLRAHISKQTILSTTTIFISTAPPPPPGLFGGGTDNIAFLLGQANAAAPNAQSTQMIAVFWIETVQAVLEVGPYRVGDPPILVRAKPVAGQKVARFSVTPPFDLDAPRKLR